MGSCFSTYSESESVSESTAKVITLNGELEEFSVDSTISEVLKSENTQSCVLCNSDRLYYNEFVQALNPNEQLQMRQIYFVLPSSQLNNRLTAPDMASLAVKAGTAIAKTSNKGSWKRKNFRISPVSQISEKYNEKRYDDGFKTFDQKPTLLRSGSVRKFQRNASKPSKLAIRSFRFRLSIIHEGSME